MTLSWSARRQLLYYGVVGVLLLVLVLVGWQSFFARMPTCSDGVQNSSERGVDCGGSCARVCTEEVREPVLLWSRAFPSGSQRYTAAAYIQNSMAGAGAKRVAYSFRLFDDNNVLVVERTGIADIPPLRTVPIIENNIDVGNRTVARTLFEFTSEPVWNMVPADQLPQLRIIDQALLPDGTRLSANIRNDSLEEVRDIVAIGIVFDESGTARAASKTFIERVARQSSEPIIFTWPNGFEGVSRAEITLLPAF